MAVLTGVVLSLAAGCERGGETRVLPDPPEPVALETPAGAGSAEPHVTNTSDGGVLLSWVEASDSGHALRFSALRGTRWEGARTIAHGSDWFINWADFPSLIALDDGSLAAHWLQRNGDGTYAYGVRIARSSDGGRTWGAPVTPHRDESSAEHGFVTLYDAGEGRVGSVWLDGRKFAQGNEEMTLRHATIDAGGTLGDEVELDARTCDCCQTSVVRTSGGGVVAFYRDRSDAEVRDIAAVRLDGTSWSEPQRIHADEWHIDACPVNGPQADSHAGRIAIAWFTGANDEPRVYTAFSDDDGRTFGEPIRIDDGMPGGRVDLVLLEDGSALVAWLERMNEIAEVRLRRVAADGARSGATTVARTGEQRASGFPRMARAGSRVVIAWTAPGAQRGATRSSATDAPPSRVHTALVDLAVERD